MTSRGTFRLDEGQGQPLAPGFRRLPKTPFDVSRCHGESIAGVRGCVSRAGRAEIPGREDWEDWVLTSDSLGCKILPMDTINTWLVVIGNEPVATYSRKSVARTHGKALRAQGILNTYVWDAHSFARLKKGAS